MELGVVCRVIGLMRFHEQMEVTIRHGDGNDEILIDSIDCISSGTNYVKAVNVPFLAFVNTCRDHKKVFLCYTYA
mgnify:CR=1 FL=1